MVKSRRFTAKELKAQRNHSAETKLTDAVVQTRVLHGANAYEAAIGLALKAHAVTASILLADWQPVLAVPLKWVVPFTNPQDQSFEQACRAEFESSTNKRILEGGLLVTAKDGAIFAWQEFRSSGLGRIGMADACAVAVPYGDIEDAMADGAVVGVKTANQCWAFVLHKVVVVRSTNQSVWKEKDFITPTLGNILRQAFDV